MWIQVRIIDGSKTCTFENMSHKALFNVRPECQHLFYQTKHYPDPNHLPGTSTQIEVKPCSDSPPKAKKAPRVGPSSQPSTTAHVHLIDPSFELHKVNELVDARAVGLGAWFEAHIHSITRASDGQSRGKTPLKNGKNINKLDNVLSTSNSDSVAADEDIICHIQYDEYPESGTLEMNIKDLRPQELNIGDVVMVNYNIGSPRQRGFWFDAEITTLKAISRTKKELRVKIFLGTLNECKIVSVDEIFKIEKPGAHPLLFADVKFLRRNNPECDLCAGDPDKKCHSCFFLVCGGKHEPNIQFLCDECNVAYHIYCLNTPLDKVPEEEYWYCSSFVKAGERLKMHEKKAKMPSTSTESQRDWCKRLTCVGHMRECTIVSSNHYGPIPVGSTWRFRVQVSKVGVHRPHVGGLHGRSNDGAYSLVLAGGFADKFLYAGSGSKKLAGNKRIGTPSDDQTLTNTNRALALNCDAPLGDRIGNLRTGKPIRVICSFKGRKIIKYTPEEGNRHDGIYKVVKYWPEISSSHGFLIWHYLLRRDDVEPAPCTSEGIEWLRRLCLHLQYPAGYPSDKERKKTKGESKKQCSKVYKASDSAEAIETFQLTPQQQHLIREDCQNQKLWDEMLTYLVEGPHFLKKLEHSFMCVCCQKLVYQPVTTECFHNVCKDCLQLSFKAQVFSCPAYWNDLGQNYIIIPHEILQTLLDLFFPGYSKG
uniref:RING-type E3 ubiquitin transferase n=1 Tax=Rhinopithecus bieti TaxID=61621 RepID=A0A2K6LCE9_RHIBE